MGKTPRKIDPVIARQMRNEKMTYRQIADHFDVSVSAVKQALNPSKRREYRRRHYKRYPEKQAEWNRRYREKKKAEAAASTTETEERMWERASVEAGYAPLPEYIERHGADKVVTIPHRGRIG